MKRNEEAISNKQGILVKFKNLDRNKIHILYFRYYLNWHNFYHSPLLLGTKILGWIKKRSSIDHVCHISRFDYDRSKKIYKPKIFEATVELGMDENDLLTKLKNFQGKCFIETLGSVNKKKARAFEDKYRGVSYSKKMALFSGIDFRMIDTIKPKTNGGFCSWLETLFLQSQGYRINIEGGNPFEITPSDIYCENLGKKELLFDYKGNK